ncbi:rhodanese-like domain-containing protein [Fructilactobacillus fructivorans]|uniref:Rhodanese-like domain protein n=2 Tax=Fructilactobacillus fructivorans TaxID=1614 RepID=A0A0C1LZ29_9LACO|nr:rhodanese-like domain-containing protein [Fructilactobacillus fructivorans]KID42135.1 Rhodanese-like domain protein [Fructilactobacillus fructivorans]
MSSVIVSVLYFLITLGVVLLIWWLYHEFTILMAKRYCKFLNEDEFQKGIRKSQVIDLRESKAFNDGHILGARNMPYSTFRSFYQELRPDLPVYLYDQNKTLSMKAAKLLHKKGFKDISILDEGYQRWDGKIKKG